MSTTTANDIGFCEDCAACKTTRQPFPERTIRSSGLLDIINSDICGPMENATVSGNRYFITFIDDHSRKAYVYFIKRKAEAYENLLYSRLSSRTRPGLRSDRGV